MSRQPAWFTMLMIALHGNGTTANRDVKVSDLLRNKLIEVVDDTLATWDEEKIPDTALWSLANENWHPAPVLQQFNNFCQANGWTPTWHINADYLLLGGRTYSLPTRTIDQGLKKQQKRARLAAMALIDRDDKGLNPKWVMR